MKFSNGSKRKKKTVRMSMIHGSAQTGMFA